MAAPYIRHLYAGGCCQNDIMIGVLLVGLLAGVISGMGIGGGTLLIPALLYFTDLSQQQAQGVNLLYFLPTAVIALITHVKNGNVAVRTAKPLIWTGLAGAVGGALLAVWMEAELLRRLFGGFLFLMGILEVCKKKKPTDGKER